MTSSLSSWYNNQHWNPRRVRSVNNPPTVMPDPNLREKKKQDSLFGPNIGVVSSGPAWTILNQKNVITDELTPEVVKSWIEKSKQSTQPTTTLQALVNLKRPTLRLSPLVDSAPGDHHHGLEFEYDCDAPKCGIYVHVLVSPDHPQADAAASSPSRVLVFESVVDGGFGKLLTIEEGASLELGRFEHSPHVPVPASVPVPVPVPVATNASTVSIDEQAVTDPSLPSPSTPEPTSVRQDRRRRFTHFTFRKSRLQPRTVAGPALAIVDAEPTPAPTDAGGAKAKDSEEGADEGVRVIIRLVALDEQGTELVSPNEQVTYLHVVRFGAGPAPDGEDDTRPWVVKVVKREATIGPHTFHLHEIYGLSSAPSQLQPVPAPTDIPTTTAPTLTAATTTVTTHTYPPSSVRPTTATSAVESEPSSECLVCLSSPREVVLLPCRHLVACKDCALNMVEFGAGGTIVQPEAGAADGGPGPAPGDGMAAIGTPGAGTEGGGVGDGLPAAAPPPPPIAATRRKRKAKGWFCPVCRQPYTSLLRITTTPPDKIKEEEEEGGEGAADVAADPNQYQRAPGAVATSAEDAPVSAQRSGGLSAFRPAFIRGLSRNNIRAEVVPDLERGLVQG